MAQRGVRDELLFIAALLQEAQRVALERAHRYTSERAGQDAFAVGALTAACEEAAKRIRDLVADDRFAPLEDRVAFARWLLDMGAIRSAREALDAVEDGPEWEDDWRAWRAAVEGDVDDA